MEFIVPQNLFKKGATLGDVSLSFSTFTQEMSAGFVIGYDAVEDRFYHWSWQYSYGEYGGEGRSYDEYSGPVLIDIKVSGGKLKEVEERLKDEENVSAVYDITGEYDITIIARFRNRHDLDNFVKKLQTLENVERTHTKLILNVVCENSREGYLNELYKEVA